MKKHIDILDGSNSPRQSRSAGQSEVSFGSAPFGSESFPVSQEHSASRLGRQSTLADVDRQGSTGPSARLTTRGGNDHNSHLAHKGSNLITIEEMRQLPGLDLQSLLQTTNMSRSASRNANRAGASPPTTSNDTKHKAMDSSNSSK
mmetsp:Transcript_23999/g.52241  ORF Transcript_23999/g.52241 Transcript_23999/m.52241 type:complete len:146 (+) Transcript_23999:2-439(+)